MLFGGSFEIGDVYVTVIITLGHDDFHAAHLRAGRVGAVSA